MTSAKTEKVEKTKDGVAVTYTADGKQTKVEAEKVLIAIGRAPRTDNVGIEKTKVKLDRGFIQVNEWMETAEPGVYAIGDIVAGPAATRARRVRWKAWSWRRSWPASTRAR